MLARVEEGRKGADRIAQPHPAADRDQQRVRALVHRRIAYTAHFRTAIMRAQKADHIILIHAITGNTNCSHQQVAAIKRHGSGKNLQAILQAILTRRSIRQAGAALRRICWQGAGNKPQMRAQISDHQSGLQPVENGLN